MIGTGVFTSLGFQLIDIQSAPVIMMLWLVGGVSALCGALEATPSWAPRCLVLVVSIIF